MLTALTHDDPATIATYRLLARLGSGGMGTVYLARSPGGRTVALKTLHSRLAADPAFRARFRLETDAARVIGSRHGAAVFDADPLAETPWLATEYVLGPPLDDAVALAGPLPETTVRALGAALAGGLRQLHSSDVVHRDLKPSNILVTAHGPKLIDFGIARAAGDDHLTTTGAAAGTPAYMSPEQAAGQEHPPAGDVFALAGVLVFAATGRPPFGTGAPADLLYRVRYAEPDPEALAAVPPALRRTVEACLAKDPVARPTTDQLIAELHDGHGEFADHLPPALLAAVARRATDVWHPLPPRLPAPAVDPYEAATVAPTTPSALPSTTTPSVPRRRMLPLVGGAALGAVAVATGVGFWLNSGDDSTNRANRANGTDGKGGGAAGGPSGAPSSAGPGATASDGAPAPLWREGVLDREETITPFLVPGAGGAVVGCVETGAFRVRDARTGRELWRTIQLLKPQQVTSDGARFYNADGGVEGPSFLEIETYGARSDKEAARPVRVAGFDGGPLSTHLLTASGGLLYAASRRGGRNDSAWQRDKGWHLLAVDLRSGKEAWRVPASDAERIKVAMVVGGRLITITPKVSPDVYVVEAQAPRTGARLWQRTIPAPTESGERPPVHGQLAADATHLYLGGARLRALRLTDGAVAWEHRKDRYFYGPPAVAGGLVFATEGDRGLVALNTATGKRSWEEAAPARDLTPRLDVVPVVGEKYVYAPVQGGLSAVDRSTRRSAWVFATDATRWTADRPGKRLIGAGATAVVAYPLA
ncbi:PQQ-binding-like beta-propeller repeat protein [Streptomyces sp. NPDC090025]|uniref:protein kinase domain-containing protein n=1 Tax=Streptomyces sp. NPDC090025 TaxID=3365922 RepID=UPI0038388973